MRIGVPGEFHEDRWPRTAEDLREACAPVHTRSERAVGYKLSRGEEVFWPVFGTGTMPTGTPEPSRRAKEVSKRKKAVISEQREEMASKQGEEVISEQREEMTSEQGEAVISEQREEMVSKQGEEEVLPGGDDGFGGKTAR